ncbi:MAG: phosphatidylinositol-specific phospholipase C1-like protein [Hyphomonadaceae bacterium]
MRVVLAAGCAVLLAGAVACTQAQSADGETSQGGEVRINEIQAIGTHNSYKTAISPVELQAIAARNADAALSLDYSHRPLAEQLDKGARQIELDPVDDPDAAFSDPMGPRLLRAQGIEVPDYDFSMMKQPGIKVLHVTDIDYRSNCRTFVDCLSQIKTWSDAHPDHTPILIMINPKHSPLSWEGATPVHPFGKEAFERMDADIKSVFPEDRIVKPDDVRGTHASLREGAMDGGWPTLAASRGKVIFAVDDGPEHWAAYVEGHPSLEGRMAFVNANPTPDVPEAAYATMNEPKRDLALIQQRVREGFLVRTRADADTREAREGDTSRQEAAFNSGAQFVSTDYLWEDERFGTGYTASLPGGGEARCNPINAPEGCSVD